MAQKPLVRSFNDFSNFYASHIFDIAQDPEGFIWIASENGLYKFDGLIFRNISKENGIKNQQFTNLYFNASQMWAIQIDGRTWRIDDYLLIPQKTSKKWPVATMIPMKTSFHINNDTLSFISYGQDQYRFTNDSLLEFKKISVDQTIFNFIKNIHPNWQKKLGLYIQINKNKLFFSSEFKLGYVSSFSTDSTFLLNIGNLQIRNNNETIEYQFIDKTIQGSIKVNNYHLISKQDIGLLLYEKNKLQDTLLKDIVVTSLFADKNSGIWIGTQKDGLLYMPSLDVLKYSTSNSVNINQITDIETLNNRIITLEKHSIIRQLDNKRKILDHKLTLPIKAKKIIKIDNKSFLAYGDYNIIKVDIKDGQYELSKTITFNSPIFYVVSFCNQIKIASLSGLISYSINQGTITDTILNNERINHLKLWNNKLYAGNDNGLWEINSNNQVSKHSANSIAHISSDEFNLFVYYKNNNFEIFSATSNKVINLPNSLYINHISKSDSLLFLSTENGLTVLNKSFEIRHGFEFVNRTLKSNNIIKTILLGNNLYVLNAHGLYSFPIFTLKEYSPYRIQLQLNQKITFDNNKVYLSIDKNLKHLHFILSTFNFENNIPSTLFYRINNEANIYSIQNNELNITQVNSGVADIFISDNKDFIKNNYFLQITLHKTGYWYQNTYIQSLILFLIIGFASLIIIHRIKVIKRKSSLENTRIARLQTVLQQQMNPHFIFNSLTSINHFVIQNKPMESSRYLTKFSTLIRKILDNSASQKVTLAEELEALEIYLDLELLRFKDKFNYSIKKSANIDSNGIKIVPFLIQPFIDRAIREHILNNAIKGTILIQLNANDKYLTCSIIDNGSQVNENETKRIAHNNKTTKSGTQIAEQRIDVYNRQNRNKISISHEVIKNHKNEISGNKTIIRYPTNQ